MTVPTEPVPEDSLPQLYRAADEASLQGQRRYKNLTRARLLLVVAAAALGVTSWRVGPGAINVLGLVALVAFFVALLIEIDLIRSRPDKTWYDGRAVAESVKTLSWKFAVCAEPFAAAIDMQRAVKVFCAEMDKLRARYPSLSLQPTEGEQVTSWMSDLRKSSFKKRKQAYIDLRLADQQRWYSGKARRYRSVGARWRSILISFEAAGMVFALVEALTMLDLAFTPLVAAVIAAAVAWLQIQQYDQLAEAYSTAVADLASALTKVNQASAKESTWALEVNDAEEAMSREHTLWSAKRSQL